MNVTTEEIKLTSFSKGSGCGCKIAPAVLDTILRQTGERLSWPGLVVGNDSRDDAAVFELSDGNLLISTVDFFMPVVDDPFDFGRIAAANAISDVYAMAGTPMMAIAILGWPVDKIAPEIAARVLDGARAVCAEAGIPLAGGHSIDSTEPLFGLSVNGTVSKEALRKNNTAKEGDLIVLTKPVGTGIISSALKMKFASDEHVNRMIRCMTMLNKAGSVLGSLTSVHALTDVTGFGLFGHMVEMGEGSGLSVSLDLQHIDVLPGVDEYISKNCIPAITYRNWNSYGHKITEIGAHSLQIGCDPQTSGGLLIAIDPLETKNLDDMLKKSGVDSARYIGRFIEKQEKVIVVIE